MTIPAYPLQWPAGWKRIAASDRTRARFAKQERECSSWTGLDGVTHTNTYFRTKEVSIAQGVERVRQELARIGAADDMVISTNLVLRLDGLPRSGQREPADPGAAVYWRDGRVDGWPQRCMAVDRYNRVADNLAAIAATLQAMRAIERHGGAAILDRAFTGFAALPPPEADKPWHVVLGCPAHAPTEHVRANYRKARSLFHPDNGGNAEAFAAITRAWETFCAERGLST